MKEIIVKRTRLVLPHFKKEDIEHFNVIKNVTATKQMFCISFKLSVEDALAHPSNYAYIAPERKAECYPIIKDFGKNTHKKVKQ